MIKAFIFDIDGVLTDGKIVVNSRGEEFKTISFIDIDAFFQLKKVALVGFITGEDTEFSKYVKRRFSPGFIITGCKDKLAAFKKIAKEYGLNSANTIFVGDSKKDIPLLKHLKRSFVPSNAPKDVKLAAKCVLKAKSGEGVIQEVAEIIL